MRKYHAITLNRRAKYDYAVVDRLLAGISLLGTEVKSIRQGKADLKGAFVTLKDRELWLNNAFIPPHQTAQKSPGYNPARARKLLVHKRELRKLDAARQKGLQLVPLSLGKQGRFLKAEIAIAKSQAKYDKRETIKKRTAQREAARHLSPKSPKAK